MPISGTTNNYASRTKDIHILRGVSLQPGVSPTLTLEFGKISSFCAGIQKLVQRYTISLLTALGSQPSYPSFGTSLLPSIMGGRIGSTSDISVLFARANSKVTKEFADYQLTTDLPADERLRSAVLEDIYLDRPTGVVSLTIRITSIAGTTVVYTVPMPAL